MILSGDIGGTKTHLAYFDPAGTDLHPVVWESFPSRDYRSLNEVLAVMVREHPAAITSAAFGIAGPIVGHRSRLTNLGWEVDGLEVAAQLRVERVGLLNDLAAMSYGVLRMAPRDLVTLQPGTPQEHAAIAVIAAGTGLGEGGLVWDGKRYRALPSEGGHTDFGPRNEAEVELLRFLLSRFERVSYERVLCGPGMVNTYDFLRSRSGEPEPEWLRRSMADGDPAAAISRAGMEGTDRVCEQVLDLFVSLYGAEAGNLALKVLATGGVYVGGGIAPKILRKMQQPAFRESFVRKGRYRSLLEQMPIHLIMNDRVALLGAAHYALLMREGV